MGRLVRTAVIAIIASTCVYADDRALVEARYPADLVRTCEASDPTCERHASFVRLRGSEGGDGAIVAAYGNGRKVVIDLHVIAAAAVATSRAAGPVVANRGAVEALDLDADGSTEAIVRMAPPHGVHEPVWIFALTDVGLTNIGPMMLNPAGKPVSALTNALFVDLDGDGKLEALGSPDRDGSEVTLSVFSLQGGLFGPAEAAPFVKFFTRTKGEPTRETAEFDVPASGRYRVQIAALSPVASASLGLGHSSLLKPSDFTPARTTWTREIQLEAGRHTIDATLRGEPGGQLVVVIRPAL